MSQNPRLLAFQYVWRPYAPKCNVVLNVLAVVLARMVAVPCDLSALSNLSHSYPELA